MQPAADQRTQSQRILTRGDIFASFIRWLFFSHANYNWEIYQGTGFAHAMTPIIRKLYKDPDEIKAALKRHLVFFNTEPDTGGVIHGMTIALEEQRALGNTDIDDETITNVKSGLMGPFAGLGDTLKQGTWFPVWQSIAIGVALAANGSVSGILGPVIYALAAGAYTFAFGWWVYYQGYRQGQALVGRMLQSGLLDDVRTGASVLGAAVLGALGAQFITVSTGIKWDVVAGTGANAVTRSFSLQTDVFDKLYPSLLPLILLLVIIWLLRRGVSVVDVILYLFGLTLASALIESVSRFAVQTGAPFGVVSPHGVPSLIGIGLLIVFALFFGQRRGNMRAAFEFVIGFLVVAVVFGFLSVGASAPLQLLSHF
jgi:mannose/fructose/N-acetylgalactosamine-specific phosphotransferase system component IID